MMCKGFTTIWESIVSAVINNLHSMPNSVNRVNSNGVEIILKMRMLSLAMDFLFQEILNNPLGVIHQIARLCCGHEHHARW
jgi:hypothetical protein